MKTCEICGSSNLMYWYKGRATSDPVNFVVTDGKISQECVECKRKEADNHKSLITRLVNRKIKLGAVIPYIGLTDTKQAEYAYHWFLNCRSRSTHGDGMEHEKWFWTYGSCTCCQCCVRALYLVTASCRYHHGLSERFKEQVLGARHWDDLLRHFPMLMSLDVAEGVTSSKRKEG